MEGTFKYDGMVFYPLESKRLPKGGEVVLAKQYRGGGRKDAVAVFICEKFSANYAGKHSFVWAKQVALTASPKSLNEYMMLNGINFQSARQVVDEAATDKENKSKAIADWTTRCLEAFGVRNGERVELARGYGTAQIVAYGEKLVLTFNYWRGADPAPRFETRAALDAAR